MPKIPGLSAELQTRIQKMIDHLEHVLPGQAPIKDFVHHNTLHGFQHLPFAEALRAARKSLGAHAYLPLSEFRKLYSQGRIDEQDLQQVIDNDKTLDADRSIAEFSNHKLLRRNVYLAALQHPFKTINACQLNWQIEEHQVLTKFQADVSKKSRQRLLQSAANDEATAISELWSACLEKLGLDYFLLHPEEMSDLSPEQAERMLSSLDEIGFEASGDLPLVHQRVRRETNRLLKTLLDDLGQQHTLRGLLLKLTGQDILDDIRPQLSRFIASWLDLGVAAWHSPERGKGFYHCWRDMAARDKGWYFETLPEWPDELELLPDNALATIHNELSRLDLPEAQWPDYLQQLALEIPGWSGMVYWHHQHPGYDKDILPIDMQDYLAVRLVLERIYARRLCRELWQVGASASMLRWFFGHHRSELYVRYALFNSHMPEYLVNQATLLTEHPSNNDDNVRWGQLADMIWTWKQSPASDDRPGYSVYRSAWRLFRLAQHLGLSANEIRQLDESQIEQIFACLDMDEESMSYLWLQAYEQHYRDQVFNAVVQNHGRGRWRERKERPAAQVIFCMDDREEGIRRHLEEINPMIETMGAAGFFSIAMNWQGLDDTEPTPLCPIVITPAHNVNEQAIDGLQTRKQQHDRRRKQRLGLKNILHQELRRNLFSSVLLVSLSAPLALATLLGKLFAPLSTGRFIRRLQTAYDLHVETDIKFIAKDDSPTSADAPRDGFTDQEQADRIAGFLRTVGLSTGQGRFVVLMGHGSGSQNNPHTSAYDCGACSGRHGGPNARAFARMANRPEVRALLQQQGLNIPTDSWFIGAEHNTCDEQIIWYDTRLIPNDLQAEFKQLTNDLSKACHASAHERCRRFASAPRKPTDKQALQHVVARAFDFSQARPELGHATNAVAFIGRRAISQGAFFDRRSFMISYNPKEDPAGKIIEAILLAAGPVAAGISLEYYFSTVNNAQYGCGSKITHNITGLFGVMDGTSGDLRTGLPQQMIEVHEAMRLQVLVEAKTEVLTRIYQEQPAIEELIGNGWLLLSAKDPDSERIDVFVPGEGFKPWQANNTEISVVTKSIDWYRGKHQPLCPVLIEQGGAHG